MHSCWMNAFNDTEDREGIRLLRVAEVLAMAHMLPKEGEQLYKGEKDHRNNKSTSQG